MSRLQLLLEKGYFPSQLPPSFTSSAFATKAVALRKAWRGQTEPTLLKEGPQLEPFSVARAGHARRTTYLVNPVPQFRLSEFLANHWTKVDAHISSSTLSLSKPKLETGGSRAINLDPPKAVAERRLLMAPGFKFALVTDIAQFFPTLYTHSLPWAYYGKTKGKAWRHKKNLFANKLDSLLQRCQSRQTLGIPVGPDTSHIAAEMVGVAVDAFIAKTIKKPLVGYRYVDDFLLYFRSAEEASRALSCIEASLREYELKINTFKTKIVPISELVEDSWTHVLRSFQIESARNAQKRDINHYFDLAFSQALEYADENVLKFALRKLSGVVVKTSNWNVLQAHLCRAMTSFPNCMQEAARLLSTYRHFGYPLDEGVSRTLNAIVEEHAPLEHHSEVAWALWMCKQFKIRLTKDATGGVAGMNSSVCMLLGLDLRAQGLLDGKIDRRTTKGIASADALYDRSWLLSYEGGLRGWIFKGANHISSDPFFSAMKNLGIHFYDPKLTLSPLFRVREGEDLDVSWFDQDGDIERHFDFIDVDDEYQNPSIESDDQMNNLMPAENPEGDL